MSKYLILLLITLIALTNSFTAKVQSPRVNQRMLHSTLSSPQNKEEYFTVAQDTDNFPKQQEWTTPTRKMEAATKPVRKRDIFFNIVMVSNLIVFLRILARGF